MSEDVWAGRDVSPAEIEAALRELLRERHAENQGFVPARVLNLVVVVERDWKGEIKNRLENVGRYHPSRTVLCAVERGRDSLNAWAEMHWDAEPEPGHLGVCRERLEIDMGPQHVPHVDTIVDALLIPELMTVTWAPHGHQDAVDSLLHLSHVVLLDSVEEPEIHAALSRVEHLADEAYVVDLAWLRSTPWRERISSTFDPPVWRDELGRISAVTVRHRPDSGAAGLLLVGWLASRLGWEPSTMVAANGSLTGKARGRRQEVTLTLESDPRQSVPGLAGVTIETASGMSISLDRGPGGLTAHRRTRKGKEFTWTVLGASRGEGGILGEGVRQALLRDATYRPALDAARAMLR
jgi:glucose-6-phosphate dehydrogenase assembly protein OpcA